MCWPRSAVGLASGQAHAGAAWFHSVQVLWQSRVRGRGCMLTLRMKWFPDACVALGWFAARLVLPGRLLPGRTLDRCRTGATSTGARRASAAGLCVSCAMHAYAVPVCLASLSWDRGKLGGFSVPTGAVTTSTQSQCLCCSICTPVRSAALVARPSPSCSGRVRRLLTRRGLAAQAQGRTGQTGTTLQARQVCSLLRKR